LRPKFFGPLYGYSNIALEEIRNLGWSYPIHLLNQINFFDVIKVMGAPIFVTLYLQIKYKVNQNFIIPFFLFLFSYICMQLMTTKTMGFHHASVVSIVCGCYSLMLFGSLKSYLNKYYIKIMVFITVLISMGIYTKDIKILSEYIKSNHVDIDLSKAINPNDIVLSSGALAPHLISPQYKIFQFKAFSKDQDYYTVLAFNKFGDYHPSNLQTHLNLIELCRKYSNYIILENADYFIGRGTFPLSCTKTTH
jgi:hypothetical protein